jgi:hypothetical protein
MLNETFDAGSLPAGWYIDGEVADGWIYSQGFTADHTSGSGGLMMFNCVSIADGSGTNLISPTLQVTSENNSLNFWVNYFEILAGFGNAASLYTDITSDGGNSWDMGDVNHVADQHGNGWQNITIDLSDFQNEYIQVRFRAISDYGGYNIALDDISGPEIFVNEEPPGIAINPIPEHNAISQSVLQTLEWNATSGIINGFKLYFGVDSEPTILDTIDNIYQYQLSYPLEYNTQYFWKVVPFNDNGDAVNPEIWSFTTTEDSSIQLPNFEGFTEGTVSNWPINNWERAEGELLEDGTQLVWGSFGWASDVWLNDEELNEPCARINIYGTGRNNWLITPPFEMNGGNDYLKFDMALTQYGNGDSAELGEDDLFAIVISYDNGLTWSSSNTLQAWTNETSIPNETVPISISLPDFTGTVRIGFYGESFVANEDVDLFIDNVIIGPQNAILDEPVGLASGLENGNNIRLNWDILESYNASFRVYRNDVLLEEISGGTFEYIDENLENGSYSYKVSALFGNIEIFSDVTEPIEINVANNDVVTLPLQLFNYPNPFNPDTTIQFHLNEKQHVSLKIYNAKGQKIRTLANQIFEADTHSVRWNGTDDSGTSISSGIYFYVISTPTEKQTRKMILMK